MPSFKKTLKNLFFLILATSSASIRPNNNNEADNNGEVRLSKKMTNLYPSGRDTSLDPIRSYLVELVGHKGLYDIEGTLRIAKFYRDTPLDYHFIQHEKASMRLLNNDILSQTIPSELTLARTMHHYLKNGWVEDLIDLFPLFITYSERSIVMTQAMGGIIKIVFSAMRDIVSQPTPRYSNGRSTYGLSRDELRTTELRIEYLFAEKELQELLDKVGTERPKKEPDDEIRKYIPYSEPYLYQIIAEIVDDPKIREKLAQDTRWQFALSTYFKILKHHYPHWENDASYSIDRTIYQHPAALGDNDLMPPKRRAAPPSKFDEMLYDLVSYAGIVMAVTLINIWYFLTQLLNQPKKQNPPERKRSPITNRSLRDQSPIETMTARFHKMQEIIQSAAIGHYALDNEHTLIKSLNSLSDKSTQRSIDATLDELKVALHLDKTSNDKKQTLHKSLQSLCDGIKHYLLSNESNDEYLTLIKADVNAADKQLAIYKASKNDAKQLAIERETRISEIIEKLQKESDFGSFSYQQNDLSLIDQMRSIHDDAENPDCHKKISDYKMSLVTPKQISKEAKAFLVQARKFCDDAANYIETGKNTLHLNQAIKTANETLNQARAANNPTKFPGNLFLQKKETKIFKGKTREADDHYLFKITDIDITNNSLKSTDTHQWVQKSLLMSQPTGKQEISVAPQITSATETHRMTKLIDLALLHCNQLIITTKHATYHTKMPLICLKQYFHAMLTMHALSEIAKCLGKDEQQIRQHRNKFKHYLNMDYTQFHYEKLAASLIETSDFLQSAKLANNYSAIDQVFLLTTITSWLNTELQENPFFKASEKPNTKIKANQLVQKLQTLCNYKPLILACKQIDHDNYAAQGLIVRFAGELEIFKKSIHAAAKNNTDSYTPFNDDWATQITNVIRTADRITHAIEHQEPDAEDQRVTLQRMEAILAVGDRYLQQQVRPVSQLALNRVG